MLQFMTLFRFFVKHSREKKKKKSAIYIFSAMGCSPRVMVAQLEGTHMQGCNLWNTAITPSIPNYIRGYNYTQQLFLLYFKRGLMRIIYLLSDRF